MPNASTTPTSSACETTGQPIPLSYGYVWATGKRHAYYLLQDTGLPGLDRNTHVGIWLLGHGEWDGPQELWINDKLTWKGDTTLASSWLGQRWYKTLDYPRQDIVFNFHSGCDAVIGSGLTPSSNGPDQGCDVLWAQFPPAVQPSCFSRIAYYTIMRAQPVLWQTNGSETDPTQWGDIVPTGLWRALRCRLFDGDGNVTGYAFTRNPIWHAVDVRLRRELFPDYNLIYNVGPDPLPAAVSARFNWDAIYASAQYCDELLADGKPRFSGDYSFATQTTLQAIQTQIYRVCRAYERETQGKWAVICDRPRSPVFIFSRKQMLPESFEADDRVLTTGGNRLVANFRDVLVPAAASIAGIAFTIGSDPVVTTVEPHPFQANDEIAMGGTGTPYDGEWVVSSVPAIENPGTSAETDPTTFTIASKGSNYPTTVGAGGAAGLLYSRFKERAPEFWHKQNMLARGAFAPNLTRQRNKVREAIDFATSTYDQVARVALYERDRRLGFDQSPYVTPPRLKFRTSMFAADQNGALACGIEPGDRVTLDDTFRYPYAGDYEVMDGLTQKPSACELGGSGLGRAPSADSGEIEFALQAYNEAYMYDAANPDAAEWPNVPGSYPGNDTAFQRIPLAGGGNFVFFTGQQPSGSNFQLPSTGYPASNVMSWASPAGAKIKYHSARFVQRCDTDVNRLLTLIYSDDSNTWGGDVNYAAVTWLSTDVTNTDSNGMTWLPLTLAGGEEILFGNGVLADGATIALPAGWSSSQCIARAYVHDQPFTGHNMYVVGASVDSSLGVHVEASDDAGNTWHGNARVLVFAWKNNMSTVTSATLTGGIPATTATWLSFPLPDGDTFMVGWSTDQPDFSHFHVPNSAIHGILEAMVGSNNGNYVPGSSQHAQGVGTCYLDQDNILYMTFNNGSGVVWSGPADIFATCLAPPSAPPAFVYVTPGSFQIVAGSIQHLSAQVLNYSSQAVVWAVDGIIGGNLTVGMIDASGNYSAPNMPGNHMITATGGGGMAVCQVPVTVYGTPAKQGAILTNASGEIIFAGNDGVFLG